jgi:SsrA-binding protein
MTEERTLSTNRQARFKYTIVRRLEAGIVLTGTEVKSLRDGKAQLRDAYGRVRKGEVFLFNCHISPYGHGRMEEQDPLRVRKLLLHRREILRLERDTERAGQTLIPLRFYLKNGKIKLEIAVARGKKLHDKREAKKKKIQQREADRALRGRG